MNTEIIIPISIQWSILLDDILIEIVNHLSIHADASSSPELFICMQVNHHWYKILQSNKFWTNKSRGLVKFPCIKYHTCADYLLQSHSRISHCQNPLHISCVAWLLKFAPGVRLRQLSVSSLLLFGHWRMFQSSLHALEILHLSLNNTYTNQLQYETKCQFSLPQLKEFYCKEGIGSWANAWFTSLLNGMPQVEMIRIHLSDTDHIDTTNNVTQLLNAVASRSSLTSLYIDLGNHVLSSDLIQHFAQLPLNELKLVDYFCTSVFDTHLDLLVMLLPKLRYLYLWEHSPQLFVQFATLCGTLPTSIQYTNLTRLDLIMLGGGSEQWLNVFKRCPI